MGRELEKRGCKVVLVIWWSSRERAEEYMDDTKFPFPLYLDPQFEFYRELGLRRSAQMTFQLVVTVPENIVAAIRGARSVPGDDLVLMAGDFIADSSGKLVYVYNAQHAHDRPSIHEVLSGLDTAAV